MIKIRTLCAEDAHDYLGDLAAILLDCVAGGASVGFLSSLTRARAEAFFEKIFAAVQSEGRIFFGAFRDSDLVGTVQLVPALMENQPHRAEISKLLVHRSARGQGIANSLMQHAEEAAQAAGKTLLVLDTCQGGDAERLYLRRGWTKAGVIPRYALFPDGTDCDTVVFWKGFPNERSRSSL